MAKIYWTYNYVDSRRNLLDELDSFKYLIFHSITNDTKVAHDNASLQWLGARHVLGEAAKKKGGYCYQKLLGECMEAFCTGSVATRWWPGGHFALHCEADKCCEMTKMHDWQHRHTHTHRKRETKQACCSDNKSSEIVTERQCHKHTHTHTHPECECSCATSWHILGSFCICCFV